MQKPFGEVNDNNTAYLGDGAYLTFTGYDYIVWTERENGTHFVHLESGAVNNLAMIARILVERTKL